MSYKAETFYRNGNGRMAKDIKEMAKYFDLTVNSFSAVGWVLKEISITVYGHEKDIERFAAALPEGL